MDQGQNINKKTEQALNSLEGIQRAEPAPWFFTRLQARISREQKTPWAKLGSFLANPAVAISGLCVVLLLNGFFLFNQNKKDTTRSFTNQTEQGLITDNETIIASSSSFDYENLAQP